MDVQQRAWQIYLKVYGDIDDKRFQASKIGEIADWLAEGDLDDDPNLNGLTTEWQEYDATDIASRVG